MVIIKIISIMRDYRQETREKIKEVAFDAMCQKEWKLNQLIRVKLLCTRGVGVGVSG